MLSGMWWILACAPSGPPDIVLVSIDGLRADRTSFGGNPRPTTPSLDALAAEGIVFSHAWSASNESLYSHAALLTGLAPPEVARMDYATFTVPPAVTTVAEALRANGYATGGFVAGGHVKASFGFDQGFDTFEEGPDFGSFHATVPLALDWLARTEGPRFTFVHGYDCHRPYGHATVFHHPFDRAYVGPVDAWVARRNATERILDGVYYAGLDLPALLHATGLRMSDPSGYRTAREAAARVPPWYRTPLDAADLDHVRAHYDGGVLAADTYVGMLLDALRASDRWDETVVLVTADHGEDLQDHGFYNHRASLTDSTTRVPLVIGGGWLPDRARGRVVDALVDAEDIVPTLLDLAGVTPLAQARGHSLRGCWTSACLPRAAAFQIGVLGQVSIRTATRRLVYDGATPADPTLAARIGAADPASLAVYASDTDLREQFDVSPTDSAGTRQLRDDLAAWYGALRLSDAAAKVPAEVTTMLREHGYW